MFGWLWKLLGWSKAKPVDQSISRTSFAGAGIVRKHSSAALDRISPDGRPLTPRPQAPTPIRPVSGLYTTSKEWIGCSEIRISLPANRLFLGTIQGFDRYGRSVFGPFMVSGKANPAFQRYSRMTGRLYQFGDTPLGRYELIRVVRNKNPGRFGDYSLVLRPISGECAEAEANGRTNILLHAGDLNRAGDGSLQVGFGELAIILRNLTNGSNYSDIVGEVRVIIEENEEELGDGEIFFEDYDDITAAYADLFDQLGIANVQTWQSEQDAAAVMALNDLGVQVQTDEPAYQDPVPQPEPVQACEQSFTAYCPPTSVESPPAPAVRDDNFTGYTPPAESSFTPSGAYER